jgi:oxygen-dependent protoporphyrinogen oxidase
MKKHIIVIGGGIAGTAAAHSLIQRDYEVTIIEKNDYLGGRVRSRNVNGTMVDMGAGFTTNAYSNIHTFLKDTRLAPQLYRQHGQSGILRGGKIRMATLGTLLSNETLSIGAKVQVVPILFQILKGWRQIDVHTPWRTYKYDGTSVDAMFNGRAGKEFLEYVLQPILNGYFYWTPEQTSRAILLSIGKALLQGGTYRLQGGLQQIPEKAAEGSKVLLGHDVIKVEQAPDNTYVVSVQYAGKTLELRADGIVCATTASVVPYALRPGEKMDDQGIAFPRKEGRSLAAITVSPEPKPQTTPISTIKAYSSGVAAKTLLKASDDEIATLLTNEMDATHKAVFDKVDPTSQLVQRWPEALPLFEKGHFVKLRSFANGDIEPKAQTLVFAGDYIGGPLMEGAFTSGVQAAVRLDQKIKELNP